MKCWSYMALWLPDFFKQTPPLPTHFPSSNILLWPSCALGSPGLPHRQQASLAVGVAENLFYRVHSVCTVHTAVYNPPHTIQSLRMHPCTAAAESSTTPTQYCAMTAKHLSPAAPHTAAHPRPSPRTASYTYHICTPDPLPSHTAPNLVVPQHLSTAALLPRLITSCTDVFHVLAIPRIHDPSPP